MKFSVPAEENIFLAVRRTADKFFIVKGFLGSSQGVFPELFTVFYTTKIGKIPLSVK